MQTLIRGKTLERMAHVHDYFANRVTLQCLEEGKHEEAVAFREVLVQRVRAVQFSPEFVTSYLVAKHQKQKNDIISAGLQRDMHKSALNFKVLFLGES
jgi:hypothetical protein